RLAERLSLTASGQSRTHLSPASTHHPTGRRRRTRLRPPRDSPPRRNHRLSPLSDSGQWSVVSGQLRQKIKVKGSRDMCVSTAFLAFNWPPGFARQSISGVELSGKNQFSLE